MGTVIKTLCYLPVLFGLTLPATATTIKSGYVVDDGIGFWSTEPPVSGERGAGNPGATLGEQRRNAHEFASRLVERVIWVAPQYPIVQYNVMTDPADTYVARAWVGGWIMRKSGDPRPFLYPDGLICPENRHCAAGWAEHEPDSDFVRHEDGFKPYSEFTVGGRANIEYTEAIVDLSLPDGSFVSTALHEYMHHMGIHTELAFGVSTYRSPRIAQLSKMDQFLRHHGATPRHTLGMTTDQMEVIHTEGQDARFAGPLTMLAAPQLLTGGFDDMASSASYGEVYLHVLNGVHADGCDATYGLSHLSKKVVSKADGGAPLMAACGVSRNYLSIVAYMLADIGWGPVVDSTIALASEQDTATIDIALVQALEGFDKAVADNLLVTIAAPDGVLVESASAAPADCALDAVPFTCRYASLDSAASIDLTLGGVPGVHAIAVDVDHQAMHVDPVPLNNFASALITVGQNTITSTTLDDNAVPENEAVNTKVGAFVVDSAGGTNVSHTFSLVTGGGSTHNACFKIDGADLLTNKELDYEALSSLDIRVETLASNGFMQENEFTVSVTDVGGASAWVPSLVQPVYAGDASPETAQHATLPAALLLLGLILLAARQRRLVVRYGALVLLGATLLVACGGGGGGDSGPAPTPPPPPVATFSCS